MKLQELAIALHGDLNGKWINIRGPGHSPRDRSLGIWFDPSEPNGFRVNSLAGNDLAECRTYVIELLKKRAVGDHLTIEPQADTGDTATIQARIEAALAIWDGAAPAGGTIVEKYLAARGCNLTPDIIAADALRFHPCCPFRSYRFPAMVALMRNAITGEPTGIHRTALKDDGSHKQNMPDGMSAKMMLGAPKLAAIRLWPSAEHLGIAEGIETALSAAQIFKIPVWAVMSAEGIAAFPIIPGLAQLKIFADHDCAGMKAACKCGRRYEMSGIEGEIHYPPFVNTDWNDWVTE